MTTKRHDDIVAQMAREQKRRDKALTTLIRTEGRIKKLRRRLTLALLAAQRAQQPAAPAREEIAPTPPAPPPTPEPVKVIDDAIPTFLRRAPATAADVAAKAEIEAEQLARRKTKSRVRVERMKAKQAGDLRKMPVSGREALALIRQR